MLSTPLATSLCSSPFIPKITLTTVPHFSLLERAVFTKWHSHKRLWYFVLLKPGACFNHTFSFLSCFYLLFQLLSRAWQTSNQRSHIVSCCMCGGVYGASVSLSSSSACSCCTGDGGGGSTCCSQPLLLLPHVFPVPVLTLLWREIMHPMTVGVFIFLPRAACVETVLLNVGLNNAPLLLCDVTPARCPLTPGPTHLHPDLHAWLQRHHNIQPLAPGTHISFYFLLFCCCFNEMQGDVGFFFFFLRVKKKKKNVIFFSPVSSLF